MKLTQWVPTSIRARLVFLIVVAALLVTLVGAIGLYGTRAGNIATSNMYDRGVRSVATMGDLRDAFGGMARFEMDLIVNFESPPLTDQAKAQWIKAHARTLEHARALAAADARADGQALIADLLKGIASYKSGLDQFIPKLERGEVLSASVGNQLMLEHRTGFQAAAAAVDKLQLLVQEEAVILREQSTTRTRWLMLLAGGVALMGLALTLTVGVVMIRAVQAQTGIACQLTESIAAGDLRLPEVTIHRPSGEIGSLMNSLDEMQSALRELVSGVKQEAGSMAAASVQIAEGSRELSSRTEQSATNLQNMTVTLGELDASAAQSVTSASQSKALAQGAADQAQAAAQAASVAASSMQSIQDNARKISEITNVMDAIAFQTNMLALNAAVEAAHAGEQGKGFGVVAHEIQTLARRSSSAAKDIKALLEASHATVHSGANAVSAVAKAVGGIALATEEMAVATAELAGYTFAQLHQIAGISQGGAQCGRHHPSKQCPC
jgi:methyl-accepting chemotaxis protein